METERPSLPYDETESLRLWRIEGFVALGFTLVDAKQLDALGIDLHQMASLLARGCSRELAAQILI